MRTWVLARAAFALQPLLDNTIYHATAHIHSISMINPLTLIFNEILPVQWLFSGYFLICDVETFSIRNCFPFCKHQPTADDPAFVFVCWFKSMRKECCANNISWCDMKRTHILRLSFSRWNHEGMFICTADLSNIPSCFPARFPTEF